jgi:hypothetical protein
MVNIMLFDVNGREVKTIYSSHTSAGMHEVGFDGSGLASGIYFYRITAGEFSRSMKMVLLK